MLGGLTELTTPVKYIECAKTTIFHVELLIRYNLKIHMNKQNVQAI
jgi:hypothetical protein